MADLAPAILLMRLRPGVIGERERSVHVVPVADSTDGTSTFLMAYCGLRIVPELAELLEAPTGMPCVMCVAKASQPSSGELPSPERSIICGDELEEP